VNMLSAGKSTELQFLK